MPPTIKFGTDGWRGIIAEDFTFDNVRACAQGVANYLLDHGIASQGLLVGYDTRFASEDFAAAVAEVVAANGIRVFLNPKAAPTPVISYAIVAKGAAGGVIITASHNPAIWNGFKYKPEYGGSASPEVVAELESHIQQILSGGEIKRLLLADGLEQGLIEYYDPRPIYLSHIAELVDLGRIRQAGLKIAVDSMYGSGAGYFKELLSGGTTEVIEINAERNPLFPGIQPEPIAQNLTRLSAMVREVKADVGLATDGDADRIGPLDENGTFITPLQVFALLALYFLETRGERGALVKTITATDMLYRLGDLFSVPVYETAVGFKYVGPLMIAENALIGGEESGGFGFRGHIPERDGILSGLYLLDLMVGMNKKPSELIEYLYDKVGPHYYERTDFHFPSEEREAIIQRLEQLRPSRIDNAEVTNIDTFDGFRFRLSDGSWLLIRLSGTEPLLRIYAESDSIAHVERLLEAARKLVGI
ncbi:MAG: phosphoglucomutase/phosphomannomutase family protein [Dehalococcoidia bacterium]|nr:MAG: phosphoglucomutase/phosphomannomutase family protein [Dehalococcoidia bacterium]